MPDDVDGVSHADPGAAYLSPRRVARRFRLARSSPSARSGGPAVLVPRQRAGHYLELERRKRGAEMLVKPRYTKVEDANRPPIGIALLKFHRIRAAIRFTLELFETLSVHPAERA